jgi:F-type H+-transporting ATPase subunit b
MEIKMSVVIASMINFAIFFLIFKYFFYKPVDEVITTREDEIKGRIKNAEENEKTAEQLRIQNEALLSNAKQEGKNLMESYKQRAEKLSADIIKNTQSEAQLTLERAKTEIDREKEKAKDELRSETVNIAVSLSIKALEGTIDEEQHRKLIKDFLAKVG